MVFRTRLPVLLLAALIAGPGTPSARPEPGPLRTRPQQPNDKLTPNRWVAEVVSKVTRAGDVAAVDTPGGSVTIRVRIGVDGSVEGAAVEESSGSAALDARALAAAKAASPFSPPPPKLLTLGGFTELSFAVEFEKAAIR